MPVAANNRAMAWQQACLWAAKHSAAAARHAATMEHPSSRRLSSSKALHNELRQPWHPSKQHLRILPGREE